MQTPDHNKIAGLQCNEAKFSLHPSDLNMLDIKNIQ